MTAADTPTPRPGPGPEAAAGRSEDANGRQELVLVAAVAAGGVIGAEGTLPWHLPEDLARFKALTMGHPMIMGRRTFEAVGRALPGRRSIVLTRDPHWRAEGVEVARDLPAALARAGSGPVMIIGGGQVFAEAITGAHRLEITHLDRAVPGDTFFPPLDPGVWEERARVPGDGYAFVTYARRAIAAPHRSPAGAAAPTESPALPTAAARPGDDEVELTVRPADAGDVPAVGEVQAEVWRDTFAGVLSADVLAVIDGAAFARAWRPAIEPPPDPRHALLVACAGARVVGLAAVGPARDPDGDDGTAELIELGVHPRARRAGHGSRLVNAVVDQARRQGYTWLEAWVPLPVESARGLLTAAGMRPDGARRQRVVDPDGRTVLEVRLGAGLDEPE